MPGDFRLIHLARLVVDDVNHLMSRTTLLQFNQLSRAATSIAANIREAYGRRPGAERNQFFRFARGSAEETDEHLRTNFAIGRVQAARFWRLHNRLIVIRRMLTALIQE